MPWKPPDTTLSNAMQIKIEKKKNNKEQKLRRRGSFHDLLHVHGGLWFQIKSVDFALTSPQIVFGLIQLTDQIFPSGDDGQSPTDDTDDDDDDDDEHDETHRQIKLLLSEKVGPARLNSLADGREEMLGDGLQGGVVVDFEHSVVGGVAAGDLS